MIEIIKTEKIPIKLWLSDIELDALEQAKHLANFSFAFHHIAIMPDAHVGFGMPIGGILAAKDVVIPNAVGVDIGCGMCALRTSLKSLDKDVLKSILGEMRKVIPIGFAHQFRKQKEEYMPARIKDLKIVETQFERALTQVGTLGGGNHFIEIQKGSDGYIWLMVHSGSRNLGKRVADYYNSIAKANADKWGSNVPKNWQLDFLPLSSQEGMDYLGEMQYCIDFAFANRSLMMNNIVKIFQRYYDVDFMFNEMINIAHNYASSERHFEQEVIVHRKGATQAMKGQLGIIPGSQGSHSYIVRGNGNPESFCSCSHGAGRKMGRNVARRTLSLEKEIKLLDNKGILHALREKKDLDEAPSAYKDIDEVMRNQADLVDVVVELTPIAVLKG